MAVNYYWPLTLPQSPQENFSETGGVLMLSSPMDKGPAKRRRLGKRTQTMSLNFYMSKDQVELLEEFIYDTLVGVKRFGFTHPRTQEVIEVRIVPQQDGQMFTLSYITYDWYNIGLNFEVLP